MRKNSKEYKENGLAAILPIRYNQFHSLNEISYLKIDFS